MTNTTDRPSLIHFSAAQSQRIFRTLLDVLARPGEIGQFDPGDFTDFAAVFAPVLCLADLEVSLAMIDGDGLAVDISFADPAYAALLRRTGARPATVEHADMVMACRAPFPEVIAEIRRGDAFSPERGARLVLGCDQLTAPIDRRSPVHTPGTTRIWLVGPGATNGRAVDVVGVAPAVFEQLAECNSTAPAGIDTWLVDDDGAVVGIPRSSRLEVVAD